LQVVLTPNTGANDFVQPGVNGEVVLIRDPAAMAEAILRCFERQLADERPAVTEIHQRLSFRTFEKCFIDHLAAID
jgi:glycosyltransferase involved in cell wall biosynthesis